MMKSLTLVGVVVAVLLVDTRWCQLVRPYSFLLISQRKPSYNVSYCIVGSIGALWWDPVQRLLFSGASDHSIIMWDIGGRKGRTLLLQGHQ